MRRRAVLVVLPLLVVAAGCARGADVSPRAEKRRFELEWRVLTEARGTVVRGRLLNPYGLPARDIHLLVEGLDAAGEVRTTTTTKLKQIVRSHERTTFDVPVSGDAERYRVTVVAFDLVLPRGGR